MMTGTVCFEQKLLFVMQNLEIWGQWGQGVKICRRKSAIFGIADPDLGVAYQKQLSGPKLLGVWARGGCKNLGPTIYFYNS